MNLRRSLFLICLVLGFSVVAARASSASPGDPAHVFPMPLSAYTDAELSLGQKLIARVQAEPFNLVATVIFVLAITHTFMASTFMGISHKLHDQFHAMESHEDHPDEGLMIRAKRDWLQFKMTVFHFLGEVEAVFGIWLIPLGVAVLWMKGLGDLFYYIDHVNFTEPIFVVAIMTVASSRPVLKLAEATLARAASLGGKTTAAWWMAILTIGPLLGSFVTEPAAMTICALLLAERFYKLRPSFRLRYATIGLLFVNISVGGTLDHFAAPPVVMVAHEWGWGFWFMFSNFGWKAIVGIVVANALYFAVFRKELLALGLPETENAANRRPVPTWITLVHIGFIAWIVFVSHHAALVVLSLLFFIAFVQATERNQDLIKLRSPLLVGFFLGALVIHGGLQKWWIAPVLGSLGEWPLFFGATALTAFNDNAAITYLASLVPGFSDALKYAVVAGAVTGGGLTVIANAPNPAGQSILQPFFGENGVNPGKLFLAALVPTVIMGAAFMLLP